MIHPSKWFFFLQFLFQHVDNHRNLRLRLILFFLSPSTLLCYLLFVHPLSFILPKMTMREMKWCASKNGFWRSWHVINALVALMCSPNVTGTTHGSPSSFHLPLFWLYFFFLFVHRFFLCRFLGHCEARGLFLLQPKQPGFYTHFICWFEWMIFNFPRFYPKMNWKMSLEEDK